MVYERSKAWSSKMADFANLEDGMEIDVAEFDNLFHGEDEDPELDDVAKEAVEDNVPDEAKLEMGHINATSVTELTLILCASEDNEAKAEIEEILNQTVPVVEEHKRKWREAGLDRILDTFDEKQIEHHVGRWMRRHNSVYLEASPPKYHPPHHNSISDESDESMHSIDTARYIQQSRRRNAHTTNKNSNMTTIKMYRKHSHKRDELRAKYAYGDEQEHRHHMQAVLLRRRERERQLAYLASTPMQCVYSSGHHMRRKNLRKRRINSWIFDSASSSEEDTSFGGCDCHSCRRHYALSRSVYPSCPYRRGQREYHHRQMASPNMHTMRRQHTFDMEMDLRPKLPENECSCCNSDRLCSNVIHIANSSTEEWVVENRSNHLTQESPEKTRKQKHPPLDARKISHQSVRSKGHEQKPLSSKATSASKLVLSKEKYMQMFDIAHMKSVSVDGASDTSAALESPAKKAPKRAIIETSPLKEKELQQHIATIPVADEKTFSPMEKVDHIGRVSFDDRNEEVMHVEKSSTKTAVEKSTKQKRVAVKKSKIPKTIITNNEILEKNSTETVSEKRVADKEKKMLVRKTGATGKPSTPRLKKSEKTKTTSTVTSTSKLERVSEETADVSSEVLAKPKPGGSTTASILRQGDDGASNSEDDLQRALAISKATYKEEQQKRRKTKREPSNKQLQSPAEKSMPVFNNQSVACNSTALANDTACYRVLPKRRGVKRAAAVSTTEEKTATNSSSSPTSSLEEMGSPTGGDPDCTVVTSTTGCEPPASERPEIPATIKITKRGILLHSPSTPEGSNFTLTEQGLGKIIGERWARKYMKYHIGSRSFDSRHSVYYQPTPQLAAALSTPQDSQNLGNISGSSASDDDIFDQINRYGTVYSILENNSGDK
ncbi:GD19138 [Drosophila simulans]|uniref:GD19138 n=1 Tax=Drosophila simulans TaxID=7240 RepID=B4QWB8_DROSI|nr:GD19138 [Drosophila simulans]